MNEIRRGTLGRRLYCRRCEGHGIQSVLKGHSTICPFSQCRCHSCQRLMQIRQSAFQRRYRNQVKYIEENNNNSGFGRVAEQQREEEEQRFEAVRPQLMLSPLGSFSTTTVLPRSNSADEFEVSRIRDLGRLSNTTTTSSSIRSRSADEAIVTTASTDSSEPCSTSPPVASSSSTSVVCSSPIYGNNNLFNTLNQDLLLQQREQQASATSTLQLPLRSVFANMLPATHHHHHQLPPPYSQPQTNTPPALNIATGLSSSSPSSSCGSLEEGVQQRSSSRQSFHQNNNSPPNANIGGLFAMPADVDLIRMMKKHEMGPLDQESAAVVEQQQQQAVHKEGQHLRSTPRSQRAPKRASRQLAAHWAREREQQEMTDASALHTPPNKRKMFRSPFPQLGGELINNNNNNNNIDGVIRQSLPSMHALRQHSSITPPFTVGAHSQITMPLFQSPIQLAPPPIDATLLNSGTALNMPPRSAIEQQQQIQMNRYYQQQARINAVSRGAPIAGAGNPNKGNSTTVMVDQSTNGKPSQRMKLAPFGMMHPNGYMIQQQQQQQQQGQRQQSIVAAQPAAMLMPSSMSRPMMQTQHPSLMHHQSNNGLTPSNGYGHLPPPPAYPIAVAQRNPTASAIPVTSSAFTMGYPNFYHAAQQQQQHQHEAVQRHVEAAAQQQALAAIQAARGGGEFPDAATFASVYEYYLSQQRALAAYSELSVQQHREAPVPYPTAPSEHSKHTQHHRRISPTQPQQVQAVQQQPVAHYKRHNRGSGEQIGEHQPAAAERAVQIVTAPMAQRAIRTIETSVPLANGDHQLQHQRSCSSSSSDTLPLGYGPDDRKFQNFLAEVRLLERQLLMGWSNKLSPGTSNGIAR